MLSPIFAILCAINPVISPIHNFRINVLGATNIYTGSSKSAIVNPIAPARPPYHPPTNNAAKTQNAFPIWSEVASPPGIGILICR